MRRTRSCPTQYLFMHGARSLLALTAFLLSLSSPSFAADNTPPQLSPNFADGQTFENLGEFLVNLYDDVDPEPSVSAADVYNESKTVNSPLTAEFELKCPAGYAEQADGSCKKTSFSEPILVCPDGFLLSGDECVKRTVSAQDPDFLCPDGFDESGTAEPSPCVKREIVAPELGCEDGQILVDDPSYGVACYSQIDTIQKSAAPTSAVIDWGSQTRGAHDGYQWGADRITHTSNAFSHVLGGVPDINVYKGASSSDNPWLGSKLPIKRPTIQCPTGYSPTSQNDYGHTWPQFRFELDTAEFPCFKSTRETINTSMWDYTPIQEQCPSGYQDYAYVISSTPDGMNYDKDTLCYGVLGKESVPSSDLACPARLECNPSYKGGDCEPIPVYRIGDLDFQFERNGFSPSAPTEATNGYGFYDQCVAVEKVYTETTEACPYHTFNRYQYSNDHGTCYYQESYAPDPKPTCPTTPGKDFKLGNYYCENGAANCGWWEPKITATSTIGVTVAQDQCWNADYQTAQGTLVCEAPYAPNYATNECVLTETAPQEEACETGFTMLDGQCQKSQYTTKQRSNSFRLKLPVLAPGEYTLSLAAQDVSGNEAQKFLSFVYRPKGFALSNGANKLNVPGIAVPMHRLNGDPAFASEVLADNGAPVTGQQPVYATLLPDSEMSVVVAGKTVHPGSTVTIDNAYDFDATGGRLKVDLYPYVEGVAGSSDLMITVGSSGSLVSVFDLDIWKYQPSVSVAPETPIALFGEGDIRATPSGCTPVRTADKAKQFDVFVAPTCQIRWTQIPPGLSVADDKVGLTGTFDAGGQAVVGYDALFVDPDGNETLIGSYSETITVEDFYGAIAFDLSGTEKDIYRGIQSRLFDVRQTKGPSCLATLSEEAAVSAVGNGLLCLIEWTEYPHTMEPVDTLGSPGLYGPVTQEGSNIISWSVNLIDSSGQKVVVNEQTAIVNGINPVAPTIEIIAEKKFNENLNLAIPGDDYDAYVFVKGAAAPIHLQVFNGGDPIVDEVYEPRMQDTNRISLPLNIPDGSLWQKQNLKVIATYELMPDLFEVAESEFLSVPSSGVIPSMDVRYLEAINTGATEVSIVMQGMNGESYEPSTMGLWKVRLVEQTGFQQYEPVTDFVSVSSEITNVAFDFNSFMEPGETARLYVEAELISPIPEYQRTVLSKYSTSVALLNGSPIEGSVKASRISGSAPVRGIFTVALDDRDTRDAVDRIIWEVSSDGGTTWAVQEDGVRGQQLRMTFETGEYLVRSRIVNKHTGVEFVTEGIEVIAYTRPDIEIDGPSTAFIGSTATLNAVLRNDDGVVLAPDNFEIQWSTDNGDSYQSGGLTKTVTRSERDDVRVMVKVRDKRAPADDYRAFANERHPLAFRTVKAPNVYVRGTRIAETGNPVTLSAIIREPYLRMGLDIYGYWRMPDGTIHEGDELTFNAPELAPDQDYMFVEYVAWIDGYRDQGAESVRVHRMRFWEYKFPEFRIEARQTADVAPVDISAYVRPLGFTGSLEDPTYEWTIPDGVDVTWDRTARARVMTIKEPGTYTLTADIRDARGSHAQTTRTFVIGEPEPLKVDMELRDRTLVRAPYEALVRPMISGGHPRDYYETMVYSVNGEVLEDTGRYARLKLPEGEHEIRLDVTTRMGETAYGTHRVMVARNQIPSCTMEKRLAYGSWRLSAECADPDGRVREYKWLIDGNPLSISTNRVSVPETIFQGKDRITVELRAMDDSGDLSSPISTEITSAGEG